MVTFVKLKDLAFYCGKVRIQTTGTDPFNQFGLDTRRKKKIKTSLIATWITTVMASTPVNLEHQDSHLWFMQVRRA